MNQEGGCGDVQWIQMAHNRVQKLTFMKLLHGVSNTSINIR